MILLTVLLLTVLSLATYLFLLKKDIREQGKELLNIREKTTNRLLHTGLRDKDLSAFSGQVNALLTGIRKKEAEIVAKKESLQKEVTNISHDLKTPLTSALGYIDLLKRVDFSKLSAEEYKEELSNIERRLGKLNDLITDFFEFSKIRLSEPEMKKMRPVSVIEESVASYFEDFVERGQQIIFKDLSEGAFVLGNERMFTRVTDNLIGNALSHSTSDLFITLDREDKKHLRLRFENEFSGERADADHLFDAFYTMDISRTKGHSGLGLAIAKEFVEKMDGEIKAEITEGGTRLLFTIRMKTLQTPGHS